MENHNHSHEHSHGNASSPEETLALLEYMAEHNRHHAEELQKIALLSEPRAAALINKAVELMAAGNDKLCEALKIMKGE